MHSANQNFTAPKRGKVANGREAINAGSARRAMAGRELERSAHSTLFKRDHCKKIEAGKVARRHNANARALRDGLAFSA
jgi:hypothetical protein